MCIRKIINTKLLLILYKEIVFLSATRSIYTRYLVSNVGVGISPSYPPVLYVIIFGVITSLLLIFLALGIFFAKAGVNAEPPSGAGLTFLKLGTVVSLIYTALAVVVSFASVSVINYNDIDGYKDGINFTAAAQKQLAEIKELGFDKMPVCMAKTQYSLSDDATKIGRPEGFTVTVRELRISAGAGFIVALTGNILTMPGLPKKPAAENMDIDNEGKITGLF